MVPGQKVGTKSFLLREIFDVVDAVDAGWEAAVAAVGVERFVKVADGNVGVGLKSFLPPFRNKDGDIFRQRQTLE